MRERGKTARCGAALAAVLLWGAAAHAAWSGRVVDAEGKGLRGATVRAYDVQGRPDLPCAVGGQLDLSLCLCPDRAPGLEALLAARTAPAPVAQATSGADGAVHLDLDEARDWLLVAVSADGAQGTLRTSAKLPERTLALVPFAQVKAQLEFADGVDGDAARAVAVDLSTGTVAPLQRQPDGTWTSTGLPPGMRMVVAAAPGAAPTSLAVTPGNDGLGGIAMLMRRSRQPVLRLAPWETVRGRVTSRGKPLPGAVVTLDPDLCAQTATADAAGTFQFLHGKPLPQLTAVRAEHGALVAYEHASAGLRLELELQPAALADLTFLDGDGKPVGDLEVHATWRRQDNALTWSPRRRTDAKGRLQLTLPAAGLLTVRVPEPWALAQRREVAVRASATAKATLPLARAAALEVEVVDSDGRPVGNTAVQVSYGKALLETLPAELAQGLRERGRTTTDPRGRASVGGLLPGEYTVAVSDPQRGEATALASAPGSATLRLGATPILHGTVVDEAGQPLPEVRVVARQGNTSVATATGADGTWQLAVQPGTWDLTATPPGGARPLDGATVEAKEHTRVAVPLRVARPGTIRGVVVDAEGRPVAGAVVTYMAASAEETADPRFGEHRWRLLQQSRTWQGAGGELRSSAAGTFEVKAPGQVQAWARGDGLESAQPARSAEGAVRVVVQRRSVAVGRVLGPDGTPIPQAQAGQEKTARDGRFRVTLGAPGSARLFFGAQGLPRARRDFDVPAEPAEVDLGDVRLEEGATLQGRVVDGAAKPLPGARLEVRQAGVEPRHALVRPDGAFTLGELHRRQAQAVARADGYAPASAWAVPGGAPVRLVLQRTATLTLHAQDARGRPVPGALFQLQGPLDPVEGTPLRQERLTDEAGDAHFPDLAPGPWTVQLGPDPRAQPGPVKLTLRPGEERRRSVTVPGPR